MEKYAIALAGGGSKGIYQIGAWKAFEELGIEYEAVTGTSIGAINGAFMVQGDRAKACDMWNNLRLDQCVKLPDNTGFASENLMDLPHTGILLKEVIAHGGVDQSPLYQLLSQYLDLSRIYSSSVDFGLCTYSLKTRSSHKIWRSEIPRDHFLSYIMASSALPGLRSIKLEDQIYIDGGIGDNLPIDMLQKRGLRNIIAIDLRSAKNRAIATDRIRLTHICNSQDLGGLLDLSPSLLARNFELGYLDTKKTFGLLDGLHYYFPVKDYQYLMAYYGDTVVHGLEQAALLYAMPREKVYTSDSFLHELTQYQEKAAKQYAAVRQKIDAEGILFAVRDGSLHRLKKMPSSVRLALLMELMADVKKNGSKWSIPLRLFRDVTLAADALLHLKP